MSDVNGRVAPDEPASVQGRENSLLNVCTCTVWLGEELLEEDVRRRELRRLMLRHDDRVEVLVERATVAPPKRAVGHEHDLRRLADPTAMRTGVSDNAPRRVPRHRLTGRRACAGCGSKYVQSASQGIQGRYLRSQGRR